MHRIVLASTSPYRKALMSLLGVDFDTMKPQVDEESAKNQFSSPLQMAQGLARLKAESLKSPNQIIIGGDQLVHLNGQILGKPHTAEKAVEQLLLMQGKMHEIITAVCVTTPERNIEFCDVTRMHMKSLTREQIEQYVQQDQPLDCAGSYKIEKNGRSLFDNIETQDFSAIEGLPLIPLAQVLQSLGYEIKKTI